MNQSKRAIIANTKFSPALSEIDIITHSVIMYCSLYSSNIQHHLYCHFHAGNAHQDVQLRISALFCVDVQPIWLLRCHLQYSWSCVDLHPSYAATWCVCTAMCTATESVQSYQVCYFIDEIKSKKANNQKILVYKDYSFILKQVLVVSEKSGGIIAQQYSFHCQPSTLALSLYRHFCPARYAGVRWSF